MEDIIKLYDSGMSCARLNLGHGTEKGNSRLMRKFHEARRLRPHKTCSLMLDTRGRQIRTSNAENGEIYLRGGQQIFISGNNPFEVSTSEVINCNFKDLPKAVKPKDTIFIDDGKIVCMVVNCTENGIECEVKGAGVLGSNKQIRLPGSKNEFLPILSAKDEIDLHTYALNGSKLFF